MNEVKLIDIKETIFAANDNAAEEIRAKLTEKGITMVNLMASPGAGKTSLILKTIEALGDRVRIGVIEGDLDSIVDATKIVEKNIPAVQLRTGGACHLDALMVGAALDELDLDSLDLIIVENIGNLVCPASFDIGAHTAVLVTSVPEGDDKVLKYPIIFRVCEALVVNKTDYLPDPGFDYETMKTNVHNLNPKLDILPVSCRTGTGLGEWTDWLEGKIAGV